jgi:hypothetical protein
MLNVIITDAASSGKIRRFATNLSLKHHSDQKVHQLTTIIELEFALTT